MSEESGSRGDGAVGFILLILAILAAAGFASWRFLASKPEPTLNTQGFDMAAPPKQDEPTGGGVSAAPQAPQSGLGMIQAQPGMRVGSAATSSIKAAVQGINEIARKHGAKVSAFTARFRQKHPVMRQYSQEWLAHSDLKQLNDDYLRDHDLTKFVHGLTVAPSFGPLVKKIAADPASHALAMEFVTGVAREAPPELAAVSGDLVKDDKATLGLIKNMVSALGLPPQMLSSLSGGAIDEKAITQKVSGATQSSPVR